MEPHRPHTRRQTNADDARPTTQRRGRRQDRAPLDARWLENEALRYVARWEASRAGVCAAVERSLRRRCERTGEAAEAFVDTIPEIVEGLVERGYVDDRRYAEHLVERARRAGRSRAQIEAQFRAKGLEPSLAREIEAARQERARDEAEVQNPERAFDEESAQDEELAAAWRTARKRRLGPYCTDPAQRAERRQRHLGVLARQGFSSEVSHQVVDAEAPPEPSS